MPAENRRADVFRAVGEFGDRGGLLEEVALRAKVSPKTARRHLKDLVKSGHVAVDILRDGSRRRVYLRDTSR